MLVYLSLCIPWREQFSESEARGKTMSLKELFLSEDKRSSIISRRMEATVSIILCNIFAARKTKFSRKVYLSLTWMFTFQCSLVRLHKETKICPFSAKTPKHCLILNFILNTDLRDSLREYYPIFLCFRWGISSNVTFWDQTRSSKNISWITIHSYSLKWRRLVVDIYRAATEPQTQR